MQGTSVTTGQCSKTRTSYLSKEILWGKRFKPCVKYNNEKQAYYVDHKLFNATEEVMTPLCSAKRLNEILNTMKSSLNNNKIFRNHSDDFNKNDNDTRLKERRNTVVLTEINKSTEILDTSSSDEEEDKSPSILISHSTFPKETLENIIVTEDIEESTNAERERKISNVSTGSIKNQNLEKRRPSIILQMRRPSLCQRKSVRLEKPIPHNVENQFDLNELKRTEIEINSCLKEMEENVKKLNQQSTSKTQEIIDVEKLIENLETYVQENL